MFPRAAAGQKLLEDAREDMAARWKMYETWASMGANGKG